MNKSEPEYEVVIIGGGPTGVTAATLLGQRGVRCLLLDRWTSVYPQPRAVHLDDEVYRILGRLGVADQFAKISRPSLGLRLLSPRHRVLAEFSRGGVADKSGYPRANMFDQPVLEGLLRDNLATVASVDFVGNVEVTEVDRSRSDVTSVRYLDRDSNEQQVVSARFVLGCDGANSLVRRSIGSTLEDLNFEQRWLVVDVETTADLGQWEGVHQVCDSRRAGTYMRVGETRYRWEFALDASETTEDYADIGALLPLIGHWITGVPTSEFELVRVAEYTFRAMIADRWRLGNIFILGDAAHLTPPFIGQGMGAGLRDALNLAWKIAGVLDGSLPPHVLDSYEIERRAHAASIIKLARLMGVVMTKGGRVGDALRGIVAPRLSLVPSVRGRVLDSETKALRPNRWVSGRRGDRLAGTLIPNARVEGTRVDELIRSGLTIVSLPAAAGTHGAPVVELAEDHELAEWLRSGGASAALVRPDSTVLASGSRQAVVDQLERVRRP